MPDYKKPYGINQKSSRCLPKLQNNSIPKLPMKELREYAYSIRIYSCGNVVFVGDLHGYLCTRY